MSAASGGPVVAIDGPAGSGKSTIARALAAALGVPHLDTGALYRAVALAVLRAGVDPADGAACGGVAAAATIERGSDRTYLDGEDVEDEIRGPEVTAAVSQVSAHPQVRAAMGPVQRAAAGERGAVVEGRDIGTVVFPDADLKVYLDASLEERARRRGEQLGVADPQRLVADLELRDRLDATRTVAPLRAGTDAWHLDTTGMTPDEVVAAILERTRALGVGADAPRDALAARAALPRVAVVGRPNVGKSTLVNRILGHRVAIVEERPGVTRDRTEHVATWTGRPFLVVDTGGWQPAPEGLGREVVRQAERAVDAADLVLFVVDAAVGAQEDDERYARMLRRTQRPVLLVANKVDSPRQDADVHDLYALGLGGPVPVSAAHGRGFGELLDAVVAALPGEGPPELADETGVPRVAIVGKPNVGKSSLFNRLLGEERSIVDPVPHTTRDAIDTMVEVDGEPWTFVDTAGFRRRYRHGEDTELYSVDRTRRAIESSDLVLFVVDASEEIAEQDQRLAALVRDAGRGVVLVLNKWDLVDADRRVYLERELDRLLGFAAWAPRVNVSALTGRGIARLLPQLRAVWEGYRLRIPTRELNLWLEDVTSRVPPPPVRNRPLRIRYMTQVGARPPRFVAFSNAAIPPAYRRYLERELRAAYGFAGVPLFVDRPALKG